MKNHCILVLSVTLCIASCAAQSDLKPASPDAEAVPATPAEPAKPVRPARPPKPAPPDAALGDSARQIKSAADQFKTAEMQFMLADSFRYGDDANHTLVLSKEGREPANESEVEEDLNVMARILEKASTSHDERAARAMGIYFRSPFGNGASDVRSMYLEGYGAIFFLNVNYSLTPAAKTEEKPAAKDDRDAEWENARREVEQPRGGRADFDYAPKPAPAPSMLPPYDAERVETLQKDLAQALRNAAHIHDLKSGETVTVVVNGRGGAGKPRRALRSPTRGGNSVEAPQVAEQRLIIRAKKSDIEAFQNEKMSLDEFRKHLSVSLS